jgi:hypothetical protein
MTKLISILIIVAGLWLGWKIFAYYQQIEEQNENRQKVEAGADLRPENLSGLPPHLQQYLEAAQRRGPDGLRDFLKTYGAQLQDPRRAWIEMDFCVAVRREDPNEAKRIFSAVKERTSTNAVIYPRIRQLEKSFE